MKKYLLWLTVVMATVFAFGNRVTDFVHPATPVDKQINLAIYTKNNYTSPVYNDALARVQVTVTKQKGTVKTIVWHKTFSAMQLKKYPGISKAFKQQVIIPAVFEGSEQLVVSYTITYNTRGSVLQFVNGAVVSKGVKKGNLFIAI